MPLVILTGASGAGKTTIAEAIERLHGKKIDVFYKDRIGVPPVEEMIDKFGSVEGWQRAATFECMARLSPLVTQGRSVLFEGQSRFAFLVEAAERAGIMPYACMLIDCDDETRTRRLSSDRGQPELANADMMNWASFLRNEASEYGCEILDTSNLTLEQGVEPVLRVLRQKHV
ncbi:AAA family ATPase [Rhizobium leguminosarum]|uniref:AAA family ATPase n=1 Tax=Rhizobium leguminosarum TaxID=384 RepID=UPI001C901B36|nr:AAA family ATPase [Rhizobium leguminosarum]MBY2947022.1 AAA family ATPase [Rhizobium leguminosarum]